MPISVDRKLVTYVTRAEDKEAVTREAKRLGITASRLLLIWLGPHISKARRRDDLEPEREEAQR